MSDDWNKDDDLSWFDASENDDEEQDDIPEEWQKGERPADGSDQPRLGVTGELDWRKAGKPESDGTGDHDSDTFAWTRDPDDDSTPSDQPRLGVTGQLPWLQTDDDSPADSSGEQRLGVTGQLDWRQTRGQDFEEMLRKAEEAAGMPPEDPAPDLFGGMDDELFIEEEPYTGDTDNVPDWLRGADSSGTGKLIDDSASTSGSDDPDDVPDWLQSFSGDDDADDMPQPAGDGGKIFTDTLQTPDDDSDVPDWLQGFDADDMDDEPYDVPASTGGGVKLFTDTLPTIEDEAAVPEWLDDLGTSNMPATYGDPDDWLQGFDDSEMIQAADEDSIRMEAPPDWMKEVQPDDPPADDLDDALSALLDSAEPVGEDDLLALVGDDSAFDLLGELADSADDFDLLAGLEVDDSPPAPMDFADFEADEPLTLPADNLLDDLNDAEEDPFADMFGDLPAIEQATPQETSGVAFDFAFDDDQVLSEAPPRGLFEEAFDEPEADEADWLREFSLEPEAKPSTPEPVQDTEDIDSFLASISIDPGQSIAPSAPSELIPTEIDFLNDDTFAKYDERGEFGTESDDPYETVIQDRPDFLKDVVVNEFTVAGLLRKQPDEQEVDELSDRLRNLRDSSQVVVPGVTLDAQVIAPVIAAGGAFAVREALALTDTQEMRVNLLRGIATPDADAQEIDRKRRGRRLIGIRLDYLLVTTLMLAAVIAPFSLPQLRLAPPPPVVFEADSLQSTLYDQVDTLRPLDYVLIAVEYGATATGELDDALRVLLTHALGRGAIPVIVSTNPIGLLHASTLADEVAQSSAVVALRGAPAVRNSGYHVANYIVGDIVGLRAFSQNLPDWLGVSLGGEPSRLPARIRTLDSFALVLVIAERADAVRNWSEQVASQTRAPFGFAVGYSALPLAQPYAESLPNGRSGLMAGYRDTVTYAARLNDLLGSGFAPLLPTDTPTPAPTFTPEPVGTETGETDEEVAPLVTPEDVAEETEPSATPTVTPIPASPTPQPTTESAAPPTAIPATPTPSPTNTPAPSATPSPQPTETGVFGTVNSTQAVNVRAGAGTSFAPIASLQPGERVRVIQRSLDAAWYEIEFFIGGEPRTGWIAEFLITLPPGGLNFAPPTAPRWVMAGFGADVPVAWIPAVVEQQVSPPQALPDPPRVELRASDERWHAQTLGILMAVLVIVIGNLIGFIRHQLRKSGR